VREREREREREMISVSERVYSMWKKERVGISESE
jgi:hypothetical protein